MATCSSSGAWCSRIATSPPSRRRERAPERSAGLLDNRTLPIYRDVRSIDQDRKEHHMTGATCAAPHGRCHHKEHHGGPRGNRMFFPELLAMMGGGRGPGRGFGGPGFGGPPGGPHQRG